MLREGCDHERLLVALAAFELGDEQFAAEGRVLERVQQLGVVDEALGARRPYADDALAQHVDLVDEVIASLHEAIKRRAQASHARRVDRNFEALVVVVVVVVVVVSFGDLHSTKLVQRRAGVQRQLVVGQDALDAFAHRADLVDALVLLGDQFADPFAQTLQLALAHKAL